MYFKIWYCLNCQGRQVEAKRLRESGGKLGDEGSSEIESHWQKVLEEKDVESQTRENKLREQISDLKKKVNINISPTAVLTCTCVICSSFKTRFLLSQGLVI